MDMNYSGEMWEGGGWAGWSGVGGEWDNCNSIINKYIKKEHVYIVYTVTYIYYKFFKIALSMEILSIEALSTVEEEKTVAYI